MERISAATADLHKSLKRQQKQAEAARQEAWNRRCDAEDAFKRADMDYSAACERFAQIGRTMEKIEELNQVVEMAVS